MRRLVLVVIKGYTTEEGYDRPYYLRLTKDKNDTELVKDIHNSTIFKPDDIRVSQILNQARLKYDKGIIATSVDIRLLGKGGLDEQ